jgi:membrane protease YdiL (CAAX protease family)
VVTTSLAHDRLRETVEPLSERSWFVVAVAVLPVPLTSAAFIAHSVLTGTAREAYGLPSAYLAYGLASLVAVGAAYALLSSGERAAVFRFTRPTATEIAWVLGGFVVGLGAYQLTAAINAALGYELQGLSYTLSSPTTVAVIVVGSVILAPLTEEILYRGLILGSLLSRGVGTVTAVVLMTLLFALIHLPNFGVAGTVFVSVWGLVPAILRLRFDSLTAPVLMHGLNNLFAYVIVVGLGLN